jgi:hypothetical protein
MMLTRSVAVVGALVVVLGVGACGNKSGGSANPGDPGGAKPGDGTSQVPKTTGPGSTGGSTGSPNDSDGTVEVTFRGTSGSDRVSCSSIASEFKVSANGGRVRWTTQLADHDPDGPVPSRTPEGVSVSPGSGTLDQGQSTVVRVRGNFDGRDRKFWVKVAAPNRTGSGGVTLQFNCR